MMKIHNFSAGPAILPKSVLAEAAQACVDFNNSGLSLLEMSHRSTHFTAVLDEAQSLVRELLNVSDDYAVLFLTGGASSQFFMAAMNLLGENDKAGYIDTGTWSNKSIKEAKQFGKIEVLASSKDSNYNYIPKGYDIPNDLKYLHFTSNNTVFGAQYQSLPDTDVPFVCDMSSDIFSRPVDLSRYDLIYAGAQKNLGPAGTTLVIVKKDILGKTGRSIPTMLDYTTHIKKGSAFNTPPVFPIYVSMLNMRWIKKQGGVTAMQDRNQAKADLLYAAIDRNPLFNSPVQKADRSIMNVNFIANNQEHEAPFLEACTAVGCSGIKGHRSVGGFRASMYNAMDIESTKVLVDALEDFANKYA